MLRLDTTNVIYSSGAHKPLPYTYKITRASGNMGVETLSASYMPTLCYLPKELKKPSKELTKEQRETLRKILNKTNDSLINFRAILSIDQFKKLVASIDDHAFLRIQLCFTHFLMGFQTEREYVIGNADYEIGNGHCDAKTRNDTTPGLSPRSGFAAAHGGTIPNLNFKVKELTYSLFEYNSFFFLTNNTCDLLPVEVNNMDTLIDGNNKAKKTDKLRQKTIKIINEVAKKRGIDPKQGITQFAEKFLEQNAIAKKNVAGKKKEDKQIKRLFVLSRNEAIAEKFSGMIQDEVEGDKLIKMMCYRAGNEYSAVNLDLSFYLEVQAEIFKLLHYGEDGQLIIPKQVIEVPKPSPRRSSRIAAKPKAKLQNLTGVSETYFNTCKGVAEIGKLRKECLLKPNDSNLSNKFVQLVKSTIKEKYQKKSVHKLELIAKHLIQNIKK